MCYGETRRVAPVDKINFFLLSGKAISRCRDEILQEKSVPTDRKINFQILIICENKLSKAELYKSNFVTKITRWNYLFTFYNSPCFPVNFFIIPVPFYYFVCFFLILFSYGRYHRQSLLYTFSPFA